MTVEQTLVLLIIAFPIAGFLTTAMVGRRLGLNAFWIPIGAVVASWLAAMTVVATVLGTSDGSIAVTIWTWIPAGTFTVDFGLIYETLYFHVCLLCEERLCQKTNAPEMSGATIHCYQCLQ